MFKSLLLLAIALSSTAHAETIYDAGGMPKCISNSGGRSLIFLWNKADLYSREIFVLDSAAQVPDANNTYSCSNIPSFDGIPQWLLKPLSKKVQRVAGFDLSSNYMQQALKQIRNGGSAYREEPDAASYLRKNPIAEFTLATNRKLTALYGVGFVSEVYAESINSDSSNTEFKKSILRNFRANPSEFEALKKNHEIIYVKGLGHELSSSKKYDVLVDNLRAAGVAVRVVKTNSYDTISTNALIVKQALDFELQKGKSIILIGLSKGGPESLLALSMLSSKLEGPSRPIKYGKVAAYLGLSGVYAGSFLLDWASKFPQNLVLESVLKDQYRQDGRLLPSLKGVLDISTKNVNSVMADVARNGLPQSTVYFSVVGTLSGNGLAAQGSSVLPIQQDVIRPRLKKYGANDGYIEYPGTAIPKALVSKSFTVNVDSSHALIDGSFQNVPMARSEENVLNAISMAVFQTIAH